MKKIVLLALLNLGMLAANAQTTFGILAGFNNSILRFGERVPTMENNFYLQWHAGIAADIPITGRFYLQPQLLVSAKGGDSEVHDLDSNVYFTSDFTNKARLVYLELPVNVIYKLPLGPGKLIAGAGPYIAYGLGGKGNGSTKYRSSEVFDTWEYKVKFKNVSDPPMEDASKYRYYKPLDGGLNFIAGYEFNNGLCFNVNYSLGLADITPSDVTRPDGTGTIYGTVKNSYFGITAGYFLRKRK